VGNVDYVGVATGVSVFSLRYTNVCTLIV